ncbi:hypothetical protein DENSPDRAFT_72615 [Dentipellis sp. KUC8613]|nr:hypothetical protein DENSPDRAFT_72615 [Dentipellis sp. KUC8613]
MSSPTEGSAPSGSAWSEPPWSGWIETTGDALLILEAARRGLIPRVTRRLVDSERKMITSGSVFVFDEDESGIKRWTDGYFWSPSRILGNFLLYRETEKRGAGHRGARTEVTEVTEPAQNADGSKDGQALSRPRGETSRLGIDRHRERSLVGSLTNSYKFKSGGMMKKTFSLTINGVSQHLISYYKIEDVEQGRLRSPSAYPELASLDISPEYLDKTHFRNPPKLEIGVDGIPRYRGEADDVEPSPHVLNPSLAAGSVALLSEPTDLVETHSKRGKRYDPYHGASKRSRKAKAAQTEVASPPDPYAVPPSPYTDPNMMMQHHYAAYGMGMSPPNYYQMGYPLPPGMFPGQPPYATTPPPAGASPPPPPGSPPQNGAVGAPSSPPPGVAPYAGMDPAQAQAYYPYYAPPGYPAYWPYPNYSMPPTGASPVIAGAIEAAVAEAQTKSGEGEEGAQVVADEAPIANPEPVVGT